MTLTKKEIDRAFENPAHKDWNGDDPKLDFATANIFTGDNWRDARLRALRNTFDILVPLSGDSHKTQVGSYSIEVEHIRDEDEQHYVEIIEKTGSRTNTYHIEWYKSRGRTEVVNMNRNPIALDQLKKLLYTLNNVKEEEK